MASVSSKAELSPAPGGTQAKRMPLRYEEGSVCRLSRDELRSVLKFLSEEEVDRFCKYLKLRTWPAEATLMEEGEPGDYMGFLLKGKLAIKKATSFPGKYTLMALLDPGAMVGEISAVGKCPRSATVLAMEESELLVLTCDELEKLLSDDIDLGVVILKRIIHVLSLRQRKAYDRLSWLL